MAEKIPGALAARIKELETEDIKVVDPVGATTEFEGVVPAFALFIDTHRDQPHIGTFHNDIHRGQSRPTLVHYDPLNDVLIEANTGAEMPRHGKHMFITEDWFAGWLVERMMNNESDPRDADGIMATSHLRDARNQVYQLKSFRQIVMERWAESKNGTPGN